MKTFGGSDGETARAITVSRQMGSGGTYIGFELAKALGFSYVDREILRRAASLLNRDAASLEGYEGRSSGFIQNFLRTFAYGTPETYAPTEPPVYDRDLFILESKIIREIVDEHDAVIMGRGGFRVLKNRPNTVHLFIHAPRDYRVDRMMETDSIASSAGGRRGWTNRTGQGPGSSETWSERNGQMRETIISVSTRAPPAFLKARTWSSVL